MACPRRTFRVTAHALCALLLPVCVLLPTGRAATAAEPDVGREARALSEAARRPDASAEASWLRSHADRLGELVVQARSSSADAATFRDLVDAGDALAQRVETTRRGLEAAAGDDEQALEKLLRSEDWQRLGYASAVLAHWNAWSRLELAERLPEGDPERKASLALAASGFESSSRALAVPGLASASLLGWGIAKLASGDLAAARTALERLDARLERGEAADELREPLLRALVRLHVQRGDPTRAAQAGARLPAGSVSAEERRELLFIETASALEALREGRGDAGSAAQRVRALTAAGDDGVRRAVSLALQYRAELRGQDIGPTGSLLAAEEALAEKRHAAARDLYAAALADPALRGLDLSAARYGYALCLYETAELEAAAEELGRVLVDPPSDALARSAALLRFSIAERLLREEATARHHVLASKAAEQVLRHAPEAPQADAARVRVAREGGGAARALAELSRVAPESTAHPAALWERIRLRAAQLEEAEARSRRPARQDAARLAADLDAAQHLAQQGQLPVAGAESVLSVLRAKAARWSGAPPAEIRAHVAQARTRARDDPESLRALQELELRVIVETADFAGFSSLLAGHGDAGIRSDFPLLYEALLELEERGAPAALRLAAYTRLASHAPPAERPDVELGLARALLDHGDAAEALQRAQALVDADPGWGDAWWIYARALDASGGDAREDACEIVRALAGAPGLPSDAHAEVTRALEGCPVQGEAGKP